jgi:CRP-like cAMP-binding protein
VLATTRDGQALATSTVVTRVAAPDLLGEIGVLHRRPRTASVVSTSECVVRRIPAEAFQAVLARGAELPMALGSAVTARLGRWAG